MLRQPYRAGWYYTGPVRAQSPSGMASGGQVEGHLKYICLVVAAYSELYAAEVTLANLRPGQVCLRTQQSQRMMETQEKGIKSSEEKTWWFSNLPKLPD